MKLELELLVNAWDNYKKNAANQEKGLTLEEQNLETALNGLLDIQPKSISREEIQKYEGKRVRLVRDVDRFSDFVAPEGAFGTVLVATLNECSVELDEPLKGAEEWNNAIIWQSAYEFIEDVELID